MNLNFLNLTILLTKKDFGAIQSGTYENILIKTTKKLLELFFESFEQYEEKILNIKLWYRFWRAIDMYNNSFSYQDVLKTLFGAKQLLSVVYPTKNKDFNTLIRL